MSAHPNSEDDYSRNPYADIEQGEQGAGLVQNDSLQEDGRGTSSHHHSPSLSSKAKGKVRRLKEKASGVGEAVLEGYHSGTAWLYAFRGIWFFIFNPSLWFVVVCPLACSSFFSVLSVVLLLVFALPAQAHLLYNVIEVTWFPMWLAWLIAVALTLIEAAMVVMLLTQFLFNCYKAMLEERVFRLRGLDMTDDSSTVAIACANVISQSLFAWLIMLITIPLNLVPVIGNLLFFMLSGTVFAWNLHAGYFGAKNLAFGQQAKFVSARWFDYMSFGFVCLALDLIPILNFLFIFTNMVGAALWAVDIERMKLLEPYIEQQADAAEIHDRRRRRLEKRRIKEARRRRKLRKQRLLERRREEGTDSDYYSDEDSLSTSSSSSSSSGSDTDSSGKKERRLKRKSSVPSSSSTSAPSSMLPPSFSPPSSRNVTFTPSSSSFASSSSITSPPVPLTVPTPSTPLRLATAFPVMTLPPSLSPSVSHHEREGEVREGGPEDVVRGSGEGRNSRTEYEEIEESLPEDLPPTERQRLTTPTSPSISTSSSIMGS